LLKPMRRTEVSESRCYIRLMSVTPIPVDIYVPLFEEILDEAERHFL
jgi:hypothetical protein